MTHPKNADIVAKLYNIDPETKDAEVVRRWDGTPATADELAALAAATVDDYRAVAELHRLALEQSEYELTRKLRIAELTQKYATHGGDTLGNIVPRMTPADRAEWESLWDDLGNVMVLTGEAGH